MFAYNTYYTYFYSAHLTWYCSVIAGIRIIRGSDNYIKYTGHSKPHRSGRYPHEFLFFKFFIRYFLDSHKKIKHLLSDILKISLAIIIKTIVVLKVVIDSFKI